MNNRIVGLWVAFGLVCCAGVGAQEESGDHMATWRFEFANDAVFDSDNQFTNGFALQRHGPTANSFEDMGGTAAFGKALARPFLPKSGDYYYRESWSFGQNMQTPDEIENPDIILNDVPYLGLLGWSNSFIAFNDDRMTGFGWMFGTVGPSSFADELQDAVHSATDAEEPLGWEHQLDDEPVLGLYYTRKKKIINNDNFDAAIAFGAGLSNFVSYGELGMEMRFGRKPKGFAYTPDPIARNLQYHAVIPLENQSALYGSLIIRATGFAVDMPREGNTFVDDNEWTENNVLDPKGYAAQVYAGINYERRKWAVRFNFWYSTDSVEEDSLPVGQDPENKGGTITVEWKFD